MPRAPHRHLRRTRHLGGVKAGQQRGRHMAVLGMKVVARTVEIGRHGGDVVGPVLATVGLGELDARDLGDRIPLVGGLEWACQQGVLGNGLRRKLWIDARGAEEQQLLDAHRERGIDDIVLDGEVLREKIDGVGVVGADAADLGSCKHDGLRPRRLEPGLDGLGVGEIRLAPFRCLDGAGLARQTANDGRSDHAIVAGNEHALARQIVGAMGVMGGSRHAGSVARCMCRFARDRSHGDLKRISQSGQSHGTTARAAVHGRIRGCAHAHYTNTERLCISWIVCRARPSVSLPEA